jgi:ABC-type antimicrobial peptide transport system permease subunit
MSDGNSTARVQLSGSPALPREQQTAWVNLLGPGWFETYGMRVVAGRDFALSDTTGSEPVAVVNETFVRRFGGEQNVLGQQIASAASGKNFARIVGVVNDSVYRTVRLGLVPTMYLPILQNSPGSAFTVTASLTSPRALAEPDIADAIARTVPDATFTFRDYGDQLRATVVQERIVAILSGFFGTLAMLLAAVGVYGVTTFSVGRRRPEMALRLALGASARGVVRLVLRRVVMLVLAGAAIGAIVTLWGVKFVGALLFGVEARDPLMLGAAAVALLAVGLFAGWLPARSVSRVDPADILRG